MNDGRSIRTVKDGPVTRLFRNHLRTSVREANKSRISDGANLTVYLFLYDAVVRGERKSHDRRICVAIQR